jgi:hypothetical protein
MREELKLELILASPIKLICQIKMSQLSSFFNDILEVFDKVKYGTRVLAALSHSFSTRGLPVFSRDLYAF